MDTMLFLPAEVAIGTDLDALLAPLDDVCRVGELPSAADAERAYCPGMLAADLTAHAPSPYLLAICQHLGMEMDDALTIGRAVASVLVRIAQRVQNDGLSHQEEQNRLH